MSGGGGLGSGNREGLRLSLEGFLPASSPAGAPTLTTPTLTPTTLRNIEQMFLDQDQEGGGSTHHENAAHFVPPVLKEETDGVNDLSTPTIANVILDMQEDGGKPVTLEGVVRQQQESEERLEEKPILNVPSFVITSGPPKSAPVARPTSLSITAVGYGSKFKRKTLNTVINELSPSMSKQVTAVFPVPSSSGHVAAQTIPTPAFLNPPLLKSPDKVPPLLPLPTEPTPLHSLASVSAIQHPLPLLPAPKLEGNGESRENALNLTLKSNNIDLLLDASKKLPSPPPLVPNFPKIERKAEGEAVEESLDLIGLTEEERRKAIRRQRNKEAAARCRKRRLDQTLSLEDQVAEWERQRADLQAQISALNLEKESLELILSRHRGSIDCKASKGPSKSKTKQNNSRGTPRRSNIKKTGDSVSGLDK